MTQVSLRPGMYVVPAQFRNAMTFVNTGKSDQGFVAAFDQNALQRVNAGDDAEVAFDAVPGRVFKAKVRSVVPAIAAGQLSTSPTLIEPETRTTAGRAVAIIDVTDDVSRVSSSSTLGTRRRFFSGRCRDRGGRAPGPFGVRR